MHHIRFGIAVDGRIFLGDEDQKVDTVIGFELSSFGITHRLGSDPHSLCNAHVSMCDSLH